MEYKNVTEFPEQALVIEDAETEILKLCKKAVLWLYSKEQFKREVDAIIDRALEKLKDEQLKLKTREGLRIYAQKCYKKERDLLKMRVKTVVLLAYAVQKNRKAAAPLIKQMREDVPAEYRQTPGFEKAYKSEPPPQYPDWFYQTAVPLNTYYKEYSEKVEKAFDELVKSSAHEDYTTNVSLRNVAEMTVRYENQLDMIEGKRKEGKKLVYILAHANCSKRCEKYQVGGSLHPSGLYSLDGTEGVTPEGVPYKPLEFATNNPEDRYITRAGKVYQNGCLTGFNCRHKLGDYVPGVAPQAIPKKVIERRRAVEEKQREYEREIRNYKKAAVLAPSKEKAKAYREKASQLNEKYRRFSVKNKVAWNPDRIKIFDNET